MKTEIISILATFLIFYQMTHNLLRVKFRPGERVIYS